MAKSMVCRMGIQLVRVRSTTLTRAIKLSLDRPDGRADFYIGDNPAHRSYLPLAHRKLREILDLVPGGWYEPSRKYPVNGTAKLELPFAIWYDERDRSIHITAPPAPKLHLRLVNRGDDTTQSQLYAALNDLLVAAGKVSTST